MGKHNRGMTAEERQQMKDTIEVNSKAEGAAIRKALENPVTKAIVVVEGVLAELDQSAQKRVLTFVQESLNGSGTE